MLSPGNPIKKSFGRPRTAEFWSEQITHRAGLARAHGIENKLRTTWRRFELCFARLSGSSRITTYSVL
jgi:hypothetical protein